MDSPPQQSAGRKPAAEDTEDTEKTQKRHTLLGVILGRNRVNMTLFQDPWLNKDIEALGPLSRSGGWDGNRWDLGGAACLGAKTVGFQRTHVFFFFKLGIQ